MSVAGIALILDVMSNTRIFDAGMRMRSWSEPGGLGRHLELYAGIVTAIRRGMAFLG